MFLLRGISRLPLGWVQSLGAVLGWLAWALSPSYRRRVLANAALAGLTPAQARRSALQAGRMSAEAPWLWFRDAGRSLAPYLVWDGAEQVDAALAAGRGLLLLTPHLGGFEFAARGYAERWGAQQPITALYRPSKKASLAALQVHSRNAPGMRVAPASLAGVRQMLRALKKGETVGLLPDQVPPKGQGAWAAFFGQPAYTMTLAPRLAMQTGCTVLLTWCDRLPGGRGFRLSYRPLPAPLPVPTGDAEADDLAVTTAMNQAMEWVIAQCPEQYLWGYNRYKNPRKPAAEPAQVNDKKRAAG